MTKVPRRRAVRALTATACAGLAGCAAEYPEFGSTSSISKSDAKERALTAERRYISNRLRNASCVTAGAPGGLTGEKEARVLDRRDEGMRVSVTYPYHFSTDGVHVDGVAEAVYVVSRNEVRRVRGDDIVSC